MIAGLLIARRANRCLSLAANRLLNPAKFTKPSPHIMEEMPAQVLLATTGFASREGADVLRKHNIATAPLLLRAGLSEHGLARTADEGNGFSQRVPAIGQCKFLDYAAEAMNDSAFGLHLAKQIDPRMSDYISMPVRPPRSRRSARALFPLLPDRERRLAAKGAIFDGR